MTRFPYSLKTFKMKFSQVHDLTFSFKQVCKSCTIFLYKFQNVFIPTLFLQSIVSGNEKCAPVKVSVGFGE